MGKAAGCVRCRRPQQPPPRPAPQLRSYPTRHRPDQMDVDVHLQHPDPCKLAGHRTLIPPPSAGRWWATHRSTCAGGERACGYGAGMCGCAESANRRCPRTGEGGAVPPTVRAATSPCPTKRLGIAKQSPLELLPAQPAHSYLPVLLHAYIILAFPPRFPRFPRSPHCMRLTQPPPSPPPPAHDASAAASRAGLRSLCGGGRRASAPCTGCPAGLCTTCEMRVSPTGAPTQTLRPPSHHPRLHLCRLPWLTKTRAR